MDPYILYIYRRRYIYIYICIELPVRSETYLFFSSRRVKMLRCCKIESSCLRVFVIISFEFFFSFLFIFRHSIFQCNFEARRCGKEVVSCFVVVLLDESKRDEKWLATRTATCYLLPAAQLSPLLLLSKHMPSYYFFFKPSNDTCWIRFHHAPSTRDQSVSQCNA